MRSSVAGLILLIVSVIVSLQSHSQTIVGHSSDVIRFKPEESIIDRVITPDGRTYVMRWKLSSVTLDYFDQTLKLVKSLKFELPKYGALWPTPIRLFVTESRLAIIALTERGDNVHDLLALSLNKETLEPAKGYVHLGSPPGYVGSRDFQFAVSPNGKYLGVTIFSMEDNESGTPSYYPGSYDLLVLNAELGMITISKLEEYENDKRRTITGITVTNDGQLLATVLVESAGISAFENFWSATSRLTWSEGWLFPYTPYGFDETRKRRTAVKSNYRLYNYASGSTKPNVVKLDLPGKIISGVSVMQNEDGLFQIAGVYSDAGIKVAGDTSVVSGKKIDSTLAMNFRLQINGMFILRQATLDSSITISTSIAFTQPLEYDEVSMVRLSGTINTYYSLAAKIKIRHVFLNDGSFVVIAEIAGERATPGQGLSSFDHAVTPFADDVYVCTGSVADKECTPAVLSKHQILNRESPLLMSVTARVVGGSVDLYHNSFTYEDKKYFSASSLYSSERKLSRTNYSSGKLVTTEVNDPALAGYWILAAEQALNEPQSKIHIVTNHKEYKIVELNY